MKLDSLHTLLFSFNWALMVSCGPISSTSIASLTDSSRVSASQSEVSTSSARNSTDIHSSHFSTSSILSTSSSLSSVHTSSSGVHKTSSASSSSTSLHTSLPTSSSLSRLHTSSSHSSKEGTTSTAGTRSTFSISTKSHGAAKNVKSSMNATAKSTALSKQTTSASFTNDTAPIDLPDTGNGTAPIDLPDIGNGSAQTSTPPLSVSATSTALYTLSTFAGPQDGTVPPWNLNNVSCHEMDFLDAQQQWAAVNGDSVVETFSDMYSGNKLMCSECFGRDKQACTSKDVTCQRGLKDLAAIANTTGQARWDTAAAIFAQDPDDSDLMCDIGTSECSGSPKCELMDGPGAWAILKSIETMYNQLENVYNSILAAGDAAGHQMQAFSSTFAPVPSFKDDATWLMVMVAIIGAVIGAVTGFLAPVALAGLAGLVGAAGAATAAGAEGAAVAGAEGAAVAGAEGAAVAGGEGAAVAGGEGAAGAGAAGAAGAPAAGAAGAPAAAAGGSTAPLIVSTAVGGATGVGSAVGINTFFFGMPSPGDTDSPLGTIVSATLLTWSNFANRLMSEGSYTFSGNNNQQNAAIVSLQNEMKNGSLMQINNNVSQGFVALQPVMEVIMFQQLAQYTWNNLQSSDVSTTPYIVYDNTPCDKLNVTYVDIPFMGGKQKIFGKDSILSYIPGAFDLDANMTYNDKCYWLLGAKPDGNRVFGKKVAPSFHCEAARALPGGNNKELAQNAGIFAGLGLKHWIIPSVLGWMQNHNQNGYQMASQLGQLVSDPLQAATVNIPVCEYIRNPKSPGVGCPKLYDKQSGACEVYPPSTGTNQPGAYNPGTCAAHVDQYQRNEPDKVNPLNVFQLSISITDANGIEVGTASKQSAAHALEVVDSALPYDLIALPGAGDKDPDKFWYSDQFWDSGKCNVTSYDGGKRHLDCAFQCPYPSGTPPVSATVSNPLPGPATAAMGDVSYSNTYTSRMPDPTPTGPPGPPPTPTYATGQCGVHVIQYQKNEDGENPNPYYLIEAYLFDGKQKPIGSSGQAPAPMGKRVNVPGLVTPFTITAQATDGQPLVANWRGKDFFLDSKTCGKHAIGRYDGGNRNMDCGFPC